MEQYPSVLKCSDHDNNIALRKWNQVRKTSAPNLDCASAVSSSEPQYRNSSLHCFQFFPVFLTVHGFREVWILPQQLTRRTCSDWYRGWASGLISSLRCCYLRPQCRGLDGWVVEANRWGRYGEWTWPSLRMTSQRYCQRSVRIVPLPLLARHISPRRPERPHTHRTMLLASTPSLSTFRLLRRKYSTRLKNLGEHQRVVRLVSYGSQKWMTAASE